MDIFNIYQNYIIPEKKAPIIKYTLNILVNTNIETYDINSYTTQIYLNGELIGEFTDQQATIQVPENSEIDYKIITQVKTDAEPTGSYWTKTFEGSTLVDQDGKTITFTPQYYTLAFYIVDTQNEYNITIRVNNDFVKSFQMFMPWYLTDFPMIYGDVVTINDVTTILMTENKTIYIGPDKTNITIVPNVNTARITNVATQSWYREISEIGEHTFEVVKNQPTLFSVTADNYVYQNLNININEPSTENVNLVQATTIWDLNYPYTDASTETYINQILNNGIGFEINNELQAITNTQSSSVNHCFTNFSFTTPNDTTKVYLFQVDGYNDGNGYDCQTHGTLTISDDLYTPTFTEEILNTRDNSSTITKQVVLEPNKTYYVNLDYDSTPNAPFLIKRIKLLQATFPKVNSLCFTSNSDNTYFSYFWNSDDNLPAPDIQYSLNGYIWQQLEPDENIKYTKIYLKGNNLTFGPNGKPSLSKDENNYIQFNVGWSSNGIQVSGDIHALLNNGNGSEITELDDYCFYKLFDGNFSLSSMPELPATVLGNYAYSYMFYGCSITTVTTLPATTVGAHCYEYMFSNNYQLQQAPEMFFTDTPGTDALAYMFYGCFAINYIKIHYTGTLSEDMFTTEWLGGTWNSGDFYYNGTETVRNSSTIPANWTIHTFIEEVGYTVVGSPTINNGIVSNFSTSNYLIINNASIINYYNNWEIFIKFYNSDNTYATTLMCFDDSQWLIVGDFLGFYLKQTSPQLELFANIPNTQTRYSPLIANYYYQLIYQKNTNTYTINIYDENKNLVATNSVVDNFAFISSFVKFGSRPVRPLHGNIDMNETYIKIDGQTWFDGKQAT